MTHFDPKVTPWSIDAREFPADQPLRQKIAFLVRYAILAPSSHNTEPWQFRIHEEAVDVLIDHSRWLKVADADQRELHISVGCALENLLIAAEHFALGHSVELMPDRSDPLLAAKVSFSDGVVSAPHRQPKLFEMIAVRHTHHGIYDGRPIPDDVRESLVACCVEPNVVVYLTDDPAIKRAVDKWMVQADAVQFAKPEYRDELAYWIGKGVFGSSWLMSKIGQFAVAHVNMGNSIAKKDSALLMSSPLFGLIATASDDRVQQIIVGQVYQRLSLLAAIHGIWCQPISQLVQVAEIRRELIMAAPQGGLIAQHPFRLGFAAAESQHTPRRPVAEVLVS